MVFPFCSSLTTNSTAFQTGIHVCDTSCSDSSDKLACKSQPGTNMRRIWLLFYSCYPSLFLIKCLSIHRKWYFRSIENCIRCITTFSTVTDNYCKAAIPYDSVMSFYLFQPLEDIGNCSSMLKIALEFYRRHKKRTYPAENILLSGYFPVKTFALDRDSAKLNRNL